MNWMMQPREIPANAEVSELLVGVKACRVLTVLRGSRSGRPAGAAAGGSQVVERVDRKSAGSRVAAVGTLVIWATILAVALAGSARAVPMVTVSGTERVSVDSSGGQANSRSSGASISGDGR